MRERFRFFTVLVGCAACALFAMSGTAAAVDIPTTNTTLGSFTSPRNDFPTRPGTIVRSRYGPFNVPAGGQIHNLFGMVQPPCTNCYITDMVPSLVYQGDPNHANGEVANLNNKVMMHHFVLSHPGRTDPVCPSGLQTNIPPAFGGPGPVERFFASGNERTNAILPAPYGYFSTAPSQNGSTGGWLLIYHLVNKDPAVAKNVAIEVTFRYKTSGVVGDRAQPLWLDIDGCGDSEYSAPVGYSDTHADWTSTLDGRMIAISGHLHDVDITNANPCETHCAGLGDGIAVSAEVVGGPSTDYFGPIPPGPPGSHVPGATLCRSEGYYGSAWATGLPGGNPYNGHLDTMSTCGTFTDKPAGAQAEAYPAGGQFPSNGYRINKNQVIRLHTEYQNNNTQPQNDVMGIMVGWLVPPTTYVRPKGATPILTALVPAYQACASPNRAHLGGINNSSCNPPNQASGQATFGTPDAPGNNQVANGSGSVRMDVCPVTGCLAGNVKILASVADVRQKATPANDYAGELQLKPTLRITDRNSGASEGGTVVDTPFGVTMPCTTTPGDTTIGSSCSVSTTVNSVVPNALAANNRAIWEVGQIQVYDGGSDGVASTSPNTLFAVQGVFIP